MKNKLTVTANYLEDLLDTKQTVRQASMILRKGQWKEEEYYDEDEGDWVKKRIGRQRPIEFDTLVGIGLSGTLLLPMLADRLKCNYLALRKDGDGSHAGNKHQGTLGRKWLFFDDLISSGSTLQNAYTKVNDLVIDRKKWDTSLYGFNTQFVGAYLFTASHGNNLRTADDLIKRYKLKTAEELKKEIAKIERARKKREKEQAERANRDVVEGCSCTQCSENAKINMSLSNFKVSDWTTLGYSQYK